MHRLRVLAAALVTAGCLAAPPAAAAQAAVPICHATGSTTNPYVAVTADPADHSGHPDLIPAPAGGCPATLQPPATPTATPAPTQTSQPTITICQATGDDERPYVEVTILASRRDEFDDGANIVPALAAGCPQAAPASAQEDDDDDAGGGSEGEPEPARAPAAGATPAPLAPSMIEVRGSDPLANTGAEPGLLAVLALGLCLCGAGLRRLTEQR